MNDSFTLRPLSHRWKACQSLNNHRCSDEFHSYTAAAQTFTTRIRHAIVSMANQANSYLVPSIRRKFHSDSFTSELLFCVKKKLPRRCCRGNKNLALFIIILTCMSSSTSFTSIELGGPLKPFIGWSKRKKKYDMDVKVASRCIILVCIKTYSFHH